MAKSGRERDRRKKVIPSLSRDVRLSCLSLLFRLSILHPLHSFLIMGEEEKSVRFQLNFKSELNMYIRTYEQSVSRQYLYISQLA